MSKITYLEKRIEMLKENTCSLGCDSCRRKYHINGVDTCELKQLDGSLKKAKIENR